MAVRTKSYDIVGCYFKPDTQVEDVLEVISNALISLQVPPRKTRILLGDFNCRIDIGDRGKILTEVLRA